MTKRISAHSEISVRALQLTASSWNNETDGSYDEWRQWLDFVTKITDCYKISCSQSKQGKK